MLSLVWQAGKSIGPQVRLLALKAAVALGSAAPGEPSRPDRLWKACALVMPVAIATYWAIPQLTWVVSPSIDAWAVRADPGPIAQGDYVSFLLSTPLAGPHPVSVTKIALCLPGQKLAAIERPAPGRPAHKAMAFYCDGKWLGTAKPMGMKGQSLAPFAWRGGPVPDGFAYVGSRHRDGFDSRYYGLVALARLTRMARML